jgi:hypothetical protein
MDLSLHVKPPIMIQIPFNGNGPMSKSSHDAPNLASLIAVHLNLDIHDDPEIIRLKTMKTEASKRKLERALTGKRTFIQTQMSSFIRTSRELKLGLGTWAAEAYVSQVTSNFIKSTDSKDARFLKWEDA